MTAHPDPALIQAIRQSLGAIPDEVAHHGAAPPRMAEIYVVPGHEKALNPETGIVVGDRGSGKSFWCAALNSDPARTLIGRQLPRLRLDTVSVRWGFSAQRGRPEYPSRPVLNQLHAAGYSAEAIWRTVILHHLLPLLDLALPGDDWANRVAYVALHPEQEAAWLAHVDARLTATQQRRLIVFDALDRLGDDWASIRQRLQGLLRVGLDLRRFPAIRTKLFMRPDLWEDQALWAFPDAAKLHHACVKLEWRRVDLYGLLWHWLANRDDPAGACFRAWCAERHQQVFVEIPMDGAERVFAAPAPLRTDEAVQAALLNDWAPRYLGANRRRGKTYSGLPAHWADAKGQVSPRSFLLALKQAGLDGLYDDALKKGVGEASRVRLQELKEDYPWIDQVLPPLKGLNVPIAAAELVERWRACGVFDKIQALPLCTEDVQDDRFFLPPHAVHSAHDGDELERALIETLIEIGVMSVIPDGRLNIPDLFRVAAGIGRRGGVRAI